MQVKQNPNYKGYRTAGGFVMVRRHDLKPVGKLNESAAMVYQTATSNHLVQDIASAIAAEVGMEQSQIVQDIRVCVEELLACEFLEPS